MSEQTSDNTISSNIEEPPKNTRKTPVRRIRQTPRVFDDEFVEKANKKLTPAMKNAKLVKELKEEELKEIAYGLLRAKINDETTTNVNVSDGVGNDEVISIPTKSVSPPVNLNVPKKKLTKANTRAINDVSSTPEPTEDVKKEKPRPSSPNLFD